MSSSDLSSPTDLAYQHAQCILIRGERCDACLGSAIRNMCATARAASLARRARFNDATPAWMLELLADEAALDAGTAPAHAAVNDANDAPPTSDAEMQTYKALIAVTDNMLRGTLIADGGAGDDIARAETEHIIRAIANSIK